MPAQDRDLPLAGRRVVALEQAVAAPLCTRHLADLGAEVIKVEHPDGGDFARRYDAVVDGESAYFVWLNRGKRSVVADLRTRHGIELLQRLLGTADIFVHNLGPGAVDRLGFGRERLRAEWPALVVCVISGYGQDGPDRDRKAFDLLLQGESGLAAVTGTPESPARVGISIADIGAGMYALAAILAALLDRERSGSGTFLDIAMLDAMAEWMSVPALYQRAGTPVPRTGLHHPSIAPYGPYAGGDGVAVLVAVQNEGQWRRFCERVLGDAALADDARFATNAARVRNRVALDTAVAAAMVALSHDALVERLGAADVPHAPLNGVAGLVAHPQLAARGRWLETPTPSGTAVTAIPPLGWRPPAGGVPALGADTAAVEQELGLRPGQPGS